MKETSLQLRIQKGLPVYFLEEQKGSQRRITFVNTEKSQIGEFLLIGNRKYQIDSIEFSDRNPELYGESKPVYFHDCLTTQIF